MNVRARKASGSSSGYSLLGDGDPLQRLRIKRYFVAVATSLLVWMFLFMLYSAGHLERLGLEAAGLGIIFFCGLFYILLWSGINRKASDSSLTAEMMASAIFVLTVAMYFASPTGRTIIVALLPFSFTFGLFRLGTGGLLNTAAFAMLAYGGMTVLQLRFRPQAIDETLTLLDFGVLSMYALWFAFVGGHIGKAQRKLASTNMRLEEALKNLEFLARHDELTGIFNRRELRDLTLKLMAICARSGATFHVCLIDLDHFKQVNDSFGHHAGDLVLRDFSRAASARTRASDYFGRYGGEEFLWVLTGTHPHGARIAAESLRDHAKSLSFPSIDPGFRISVSVGVAEYRAGDSMEKLIGRADAALYRAKGGGRDRVEFDHAILPEAPILTAEV